MMSLLQVLLLLVVKLPGIWAFSEGPPLSTCEYMVPHHGYDNKAQIGEPPYSISVSSISYTAGENLTVKISGANTFKGFILQAQGINSSVAWPVGEFVKIPSDTQHLYCSGGDLKNTVGHNNTGGKIEWNSLQFTWMAPAKTAGNISFVATIVHNYTTFWTRIVSSVVAGPPAEEVTRGDTTESFQISKNGCGETKGCYSLPSSCTGSTDCDYLFTYQVSAENVTLEMSAKERWVSVAFNGEKLMDKMDAIMCVTMATNLAELRHFYSYDHHVDRQNLAGNSDITLTKIVYEDGGIKCKLIRKLTSSAAHFRDLTKKWYLLFAHGKTSPSGSSQYHYGNRFFTGATVNLSVPEILFHEGAKETISKDGCGETKTCYSEPESCTTSSDCQYLVTIKPVGDEDSDVGEVEFELSTTGKWGAIGFNNKKNKMPGTDALICAAVDGNVSVDHYNVQGYDQPTKTTPRPDSLVLDFGELSGEVLSCRFRRKKKDDKMVDLRESWHLVYASGPMNGDAIGKHSTTPKTSAEKVKVDAIRGAKKTISKDGCGETKSCYSEPEGCTSNSDCQYLVTIKPVGSEDSDVGEVEFELSTKEQWASIGFNNEKNKMPGTDALICAAVDGNVSVDHYKVQGYDQPTKTTPRPASLVLDFGELSARVLSCRFRRKKKDDKMVDLTESWHLVYASGPMKGDAIGKHSTTPKTSPEKVKVDDIGTLAADKEGPGMIQAHGCLMVIAWVGFASIGIFMARYMKVVFGEKVLLGTKVWFTFHRSLMILTVLFTIVSIILIFVHAGRWTKEAGAHPITGIIVLVLAVIQPIMALFRPHPGEDKRYIFNWAHRGVGLSSLILAVVTVFLGIRLPDSNLEDSALYPMIVYCVGVAIVIVFEFYLNLKKDTRAAKFSPVKGEEDGGDLVTLQPSGNQFLFARQLMLGFLVVLVSGVVIALVVLIAIADGEGGHEHEH